ncbi:hypothetical protein QTO34_000483 [Cnephaeus nilssonii]|uniref:Ribosome biogenesis protein NOP53 n=1 Tax=Cnephaeus nilssonii TaxID=3371016 RepID=A0AA40IBM2_CNENI|nr:hypothetical protein QTO34_000483 [Eptesicus nilssonii]
MQGQLLNPPMAKAKPRPQDTVEQPFYNLWAKDNPVERLLASQDPFLLEQTKKKGVPAVEVTPLGAFYNPSFEDHQTLLWEAHEVELLWQKKAEKLQLQLTLPLIEQATT